MIFIIVLIAREWHCILNYPRRFYSHSQKYVWQYRVEYFAGENILRMDPLR